MEILLTLTYVALCYATFKLFRIPVNQWTLATAALGGIFGLSLLFITMAYNHPFSTNARIYFTVTPILPSVRGRVIEVLVEDRTNQHLGQDADGDRGLLACGPLSGGQDQAGRRSDAGAHGRRPHLGRHAAAG